MRKLLAVVAVVGLVGFATSCKKECKCTIGPVEMDLSKLGIDTKDKCMNLVDATTSTVCEWK
jgi:hypothetical protein